jgi:hypothetical protein
VARISPADRNAERRLHRTSNSPAGLCPVCRRLADADGTAKDDQ